MASIIMLCKKIVFVLVILIIQLSGVQRAFCQMDLLFREGREQADSTPLLKTIYQRYGDSKSLNFFPEIHQYHTNIIFKGYFVSKESRNALKFNLTSLSEAESVEMKYMINYLKKRGVFNCKKSALPENIEYSCLECYFVSKVTLSSGTFEDYPDIENWKNPVPNDGFIWTMNSIFFTLEGVPIMNGEISTPLLLVLNDGSMYPTFVEKAVSNRGSHSYARIFDHCEACVNSGTWLQEIFSAAVKSLGNEFEIPLSDSAIMVLDYNDHFFSELKKPTFNQSAFFYREGKVLLDEYLLNDIQAQEKFRLFILKSIIDKLQQSPFQAVAEFERSGSALLSVSCRKSEILPSKLYETGTYHVAVFFENTPETVAISYLITVCFYTASHCDNGKYPISDAEIDVFKKTIDQMVEPILNQVRITAVRH